MLTGYSNEEMAVKLNVIQSTYSRIETDEHKLSVDILTFLSKDGNKEALGYLKKGYKAVEISTLTGLHVNTISKARKLGLNL